MNPYSALIRPPEGKKLITFVSEHLPVVQLPPGHPRSAPSVLPFGHEEGVVLVIARDETAAAMELQEALGPAGAILCGPAPLQAVVPVSS